MRREFFVALISALVACAATAWSQDTSEAEPAQLDAISVNVSFWGNQIASWEIERAGSGTAQRQDDAPRTFAVSSQDFERLRVILAPVERFIDGGIPCKVRVTDQFYGAIRWRSGSTIESVPYDYGCQSPDAGLVFDRLYEAGAEIERLSGAEEAAAESGFAPWPDRR
jgi:hypothetical protein